jgi:hypothetical protein
LNNTGKQYLTIENKENKPWNQNRTSSSTNKSFKEAVKEATEQTTKK